jgi:pimeloyl-ACP methyl ester carboxylesterase
MLKKIFTGLMAVCIILVIVYMLGPKATIEKLDGNYPSVPTLVDALENFIWAKSDTVKGLKPNNEAKIIWVDSLNPSKTSYSILYIHGFGASEMEGAPVHRELAKELGANLYLLRLPEHGIERDDAFKFLTAQHLVDEVREAYMIGKALGDSLVVVGTSMGGALALTLAAEQPDIKALILYSPAIREFGSSLDQFFQPWMKYLAEHYFFPNGVRVVPRQGEKAKYWSEAYHVNGYSSLAVLLRSKMTPETFSKVRQPLFMGYFYKSEQEQDFVVSVPHMLEMFESVSTPDSLKVKMDFPEAGDHVISSKITSKDWQGVLKATLEFLENTTNIPVREWSEVED